MNNLNTRTIFHLAFPVHSLEESKHFYINLLGAEVGRENDAWLDILIWGHQITLHQQPAEVLPREKVGTRHFGVILPWTDWENLAQRIVANHGKFMKEPQILHQGTYEEQGKFYLEDPSFNVIEIKAYRSFAETLGQNKDDYNYSDQ